jgi:trigger factor
VKFTTEKLPKSLIAIDVELDNQQVEKGLDRAARKISQQTNIPGFRKGKAPRFIVENYYGRDFLLQEATEDLVNQTFKQLLKDASIEPVGPASLESVEHDPFRFRVMVPIAPTVTLPDYRAIRLPLDVDPISDEDVQGALNRLRDKHAVLQELDEPRPAQDGDQLSVKIESFADGEPLDPRPEGQELKEQALVLEQGRLVDELYQGLLGAEVGQSYDIVAHMAEDHANEQIRDKDVTFKVEVLGTQARLLPDWDELPTLEEFDGTLDELRAKTRGDLEAATRSQAERQLLDSFVEQLVAQTEYDIPDTLVQNEAEHLLEEQLSSLTRYGITIDQYLQYRGQSREDAVSELLPQAETRLKTSLAIQDLVRREGLNVSFDELQDEIGRVTQQYGDDDRDRVMEILNTKLAPNIASQVLDRKLRDLLLLIAQGQSPELPEPVPTASPDDAPDAVDTNTNEPTPSPVLAEASTGEAAAADDRDADSRA